MGLSTHFETTEPARADVDTWQEPAVIEFGTPWCGFCQAAQPLITAAFTDFPQVRHIKVEDGRGRPLGRSYRVKLWPTLIFLQRGQEIARVVRPTSAEEVRNALEQLAKNEYVTAPGS